MTVHFLNSKKSPQVFDFEAESKREENRDDIANMIAQVDELILRVDELIEGLTILNMQVRK